MKHSRRGQTEFPVVKRHQLNKKKLLLTIPLFLKQKKKEKNENRRIIKIPAQHSKPSFTPLKKVWIKYSKF